MFNKCYQPPILSAIEGRSIYNEQRSDSYSLLAYTSKTSILEFCRVYKLDNPEISCLS
jgi:hypothetical protein